MPYTPSMKAYRRFLVTGTVIWILDAIFDVILWTRGAPVTSWTMLNSSFAGVTAMLGMMSLYEDTSDTAWLRLMIPFGMIVVFALFGYAHYLLLIVAQLAAATTLLLRLRHVKS